MATPQSSLPYGSTPQTSPTSGTPNPANPNYNVYSQMDPNFINYSDNYYNPTQLASTYNMSNADQMTAYSNALVNGTSPAYIESPTLLGNRYFLDTKTQCQDVDGNPKPRSVLIDNVLASSIQDPAFQGNQGLLYSITAALDNISSTAYYPSITKPPSGQTLPLCQPISVYIDGTNTATANGYVLSSDMQNIDTLAIAPTKTVEGFATASAPLILDPNSANGRIDTAKVLQQHSAIQAATKANSIGLYQQQYDASYGQPAMSILDLFVTYINYNSPVVTDASFSIATILSTFKLCSTKPTIPLCSSTTSSVPSTAKPTVPLNRYNQKSADVSAQAAANNQASKAKQANVQVLPSDSSANLFITEILDFINKPSMTAYIQGYQPGPPLPQYLVNDVGFEYDQEQSKTLNPEYVAFTKKYCMYPIDLSEFEVYRKLIITQMLKLDHPELFSGSPAPALAPASATTNNESFVAYREYGQLSPANYKYNSSDVIQAFYVGSLTVIGLYMCYRIYKKLKKP